MAEDPEKRIGLHCKYIVTRRDGSSEAGGKHEDCDYFVLDLMHDKFAFTAMMAYISACEKDYPLLAEDLRDLVYNAEEKKDPNGRT